MRGYSCYASDLKSPLPFSNRDCTFGFPLDRGDRGGVPLPKSDVLPLLSLCKRVGLSDAALISLASAFFIANLCRFENSLICLLWFLFLPLVRVESPNDSSVDAYDENVQFQLLYHTRRKNKMGYENCTCFVWLISKSIHNLQIAHLQNSKCFFKHILQANIDTLTKSLLQDLIHYISNSGHKINVVSYS